MHTKFSTLLDGELLALWDTRAIPPEDYEELIAELVKRFIKRKASL